MRRGFLRLDLLGFVAIGGAVAAMGLWCYMQQTAATTAAAGMEKVAEKLDTLVATSEEAWDIAMDEVADLTADAQSLALVEAPQPFPMPTSRSERSRRGGGNLGFRLVTGIASGSGSDRPGRSVSVTPRTPAASMEIARSRSETIDASIRQLGNDISGQGDGAEVTFESGTWPEVAPTVAAAPLREEAEIAETTAEQKAAIAHRLPVLPAADPAGNALSNRSIDGLDGWRKMHTSSVDDSVTLAAVDNYVFWERTASRNTEGTIGVCQDVNVDASTAQCVEFDLDVLVHYHTLQAPDAQAHPGVAGGQTPARLTVLYKDALGGEHEWSHGFLIHPMAQEVLVYDRSVGRMQYKPGVTPQPDLSPVQRARWCHFSFDLMQEAWRSRQDGGSALPRPARILRVTLTGGGWNFAAAVGNLALHVR